MAIKRLPRKILVLAGSPVRDGNTDTLAGWFAEGARAQGAEVEVVRVAAREFRSAGCTSCRACQKLEAYACVIRDDASAALAKMAKADAIIMATPLYFFSASAQLKTVFDRMFSLYKWDNAAGTMQTPLAGKTFGVIASAYEGAGFDALEKPFRLTAEYTGMKFYSLRVPNAGVSGDIRGKQEIRRKAAAFGKKIAKG
ncbi:MAG TPA: flavodoxin family protein [bacterium]|nr:flavodoxin family protein [bacterium]